MIAKVIAHGPNRDGALTTLAGALRDTVIWPVKTNAGFLVKALGHPDFATAGRLDTSFIGREGGALMPSPLPGKAALADAAARLAASGILPGFRLNGAPCLEGRFLLDGSPVTIAFGPPAAHPDGSPNEVLVAEGGQVWRLAPWRAVGSVGADATDGAILSPMPGRIIAVAVAAGDSVRKGQKLVTLEAMKMEHNLLAPFDGTISELNAREGGQVGAGTVVARIA